MHASKGHEILDSMVVSKTQKSNVEISTKAAHYFCVHLFSVSIICRTLKNVNKNIEIPIFY